MVNQCANPQCAKPLHYLREGRVYIFDMPDTNAPAESKRSRRMEHFWLCGPCSQLMLIEQTAEGVRVVQRPAMRLMRKVPATKTAIAS